MVRLETIWCEALIFCFVFVSPLNYLFTFPNCMEQYFGKCNKTELSRGRHQLFIVYQVLLNLYIKVLKHSQFLSYLIVVWHRFMDHTLFQHCASTQPCIPVSLPFFSPFLRNLGRKPPSSQCYMRDHQRVTHNELDYFQGVQWGQKRGPVPPRSIRPLGPCSAVYLCWGQVCIMEWSGEWKECQTGSSWECSTNTS